MINEKLAYLVGCKHARLGRIPATGAPDAYYWGYSDEIDKLYTLK